jgi:thiamine kinase-like enzyme
MMACDDQTPEDDAASTVSVTKIHSWLREKRCDQSRCGGMLKKEGAHLEIFSLQNQGEIDELARRADELQQVRVFGNGMVEERIEQAQLCQKQSSVSDGIFSARRFTRLHVPVRSEGQARGQRDVGCRSDRRALEDTSRPAR